MGFKSQFKKIKMLPNSNHNRNLKLKLFGSFLLLLLSLCYPVVGQAEQAQYVYDELGRLFRVIDGSGNVGTYHYDPVGNLLEITRETTTSLSPTLASITPDYGRQRTEVDVTIIGTNLDASTLTTGNPGITVTDPLIEDSTTITARFVISDTATIGTTLVQVDNGIGTANFNFTVIPLAPTTVIIPSLIFVAANGGTATATISLENDDGFPTQLTVSTGNSVIATVSPTQIELQPGASEVVTITGVNPGETTLVVTSSETTTATINVGHIRDIAAGGNHTCAVLSNGTVKCWGYNGQCQVGKYWDYPWIESTPLMVPNISTAIKIAVGSSHSCVIIADGRVLCWGYNGLGTLGNGNNTTTYLPSYAIGINNAIDIAAGEYHSCAALSDGTVKCWGRNDFGPLGNGTVTSSNVPVTVTGINSAVEVVAGGNHSCAILEDGTVKCWGWNQWGQLGNGINTGPETCQIYTCSTTPVSVSGISDVVSMGAGYGHTCALLSNGIAKCWGSNGSQLGNGTFAGDIGAPDYIFNPGSVIGFSTGVALSSSGSANTCALLADQTIKCWGLNNHGQIGTGSLQGPEVCFSNNCAKTPVSVTGISTAVIIATGGEHSCAILSNGTAKCWGSNANGQLGNGTNTTSYPFGIPTPVTIFFIEDSTAPTVTITSPPSGDSFIEGTSFPLTVQATDYIQVVSVNFIVDGQTVFTDPNPPYEFDVSVPVGASTLTLGATAIDLAGNVGVASDVVINVIPDPNTTVTGRVLDNGGFPVSGATVTTNFGQTALTITDGTFQIMDVPTIQGSVTVMASYTNQNGEVFQATSAPVTPIPYGTVSVGVLIIEFVYIEFDFSDPSLAPNLTQVDFTGTVDSLGGDIGNGGAISEDGVLKLSNSVSPSFPGGIHAKIRSSQAILVGDFDVTIDFDLIIFPTVSASGQETFMTAGFGVTDLQGNETYIDRIKDATSDGYQLSGVFGGTPITPVLASGVSDSNGKLRLQRAKDRIWGYYFDSSINEWVYLGISGISTDPLFIEISTFNRRSGQPIEAHFDNLKAEFVKAIELVGVPELVLGLTVSPSGDFFVSSVEDIGTTGDGGVYKVTPGGFITPFSSVPDARSLVFDPAGNLFVGDSVPSIHSKIIKVTPDETATVFVPAEDFPNTSRTITQLAFDPAGFLYAPSGDTANDADFVYQIDSQGTVSTLVNGIDFNGIATDTASNVYTSGTLDGILYKIPSGGSLTSLSSGFSTPFQTAIAVTLDDSLFILNKVTGEIFWVDSITGTKVKIAQGTVALASDSQGSLYSIQRLQGVLHIIRVRPATLN